MDNHLCQTLHFASGEGHTECIRTLLDKQYVNSTV